MSWKRPLAIIPNGVPTDIFTPAPTPIVPGGAPVKLLFVGRIGDRRKGARYLFDAYRSLLARGLPVTLDVAGELGNAEPPPELPGLRYHGAVNFDELVQLYRACDVFVAPSTGQESFGIVLLEAMASAKPVVCSDIEGYRQVAVPNGAFLVPPADANVLAERLAEIVQLDPIARMRLGDVNRKAALGYDWDRLARPRARRVLRCDRGTRCGPRTFAVARQLRAERRLIRRSLETHRRWLAHALRVAVIAAIAVLLWLLIRKIDWTRLGRELAHATVWPLIVAALLNYVLLIGKAVSWRIMLAPNHRVSTARLVRYTIVAFAASVLAPARAGELLRVWLLKRRDGVPVADVAAVAIAEKLLDGVTMLVIVAPLHWLLPDLPAWVTRSILICAAVAVAAFVGLFVAVGRVEIDDSSSWFARFIAGMHVIRSGRRLVLVIGSLLIVWITDLLMIWLVAHAVGIELSLGGGLLILFTLNLTITAPSTPARVGALEVGVLAATRLLGIADEPAFALALLYHLLQIVPLIIVGLCLEWRLVLGKANPNDA